ncbi:hypothetical protein [Pseudobutyrivibrio sp.]|uniref:hypothetical protein n=1 Tax=Pseudobutyrivibrio sp. TaxID=2014367 RepID=UPI0026011447|nr:hypothetical protein [Pseudobutyrivibrio sp.]MBR5649715.1 hypothetical protein [Pseudobutyrivibrio sp.]
MSITFELTEDVKEIRVSNGAENEIIDISKGPANNSLLVLEQKKALVGQLNTTVLFNNLSICGDLFGIAYDAVNGKPVLQRDVYTLRQHMIDATGDSANDVNGFENIIEDVGKIYKSGIMKLLKKPADKEVAKKRFNEISNKAGVISDGAKDLVELFVKLRAEASNIATEMIDAKVLNLEQNKQLQKNMDELNAKISGLEKVQEGLVDDIEQLDEDYNRISKKIDKAEDRAFIMGIVSAVTGAIGTAVNGYVSATNAGMVSNATKNLAETSGQNQGKLPKNVMSSTQNYLTLTNDKIQKTEEKIANLKKDIEEKDKEISEENDSDKKTKLLDQKKQLYTLKEQEEASLITLKSEANVYSATLSSVGAGFSDVSSRLEAQGSALQDTVAGLTAMADSISERRWQLKKEKREILKQIAEYTSQIETSVATKDSLELAIAAMSAGIGAMNYILSVLNDFKYFWDRVTQYTKNLSEKDMDMEIDDIDDLDVIGIDLLCTIATSMCQWVALKLVLEDYENAFVNVREKLQAQYKEDEDPDPEVMWNRAIKKSKGMSELIKVQAEGV